VYSTDAVFWVVDPGEDMKLVMAFTLAALCSMFFAGDAEARKMRFRVLPIPGVHGSSSTEKAHPVPIGVEDVRFVHDLPAAFAEEGEHFDLGYKFGMFGGGEWVGYFKTSQRYVDLKQDKVRELLPLLGISEADAPKRSFGSQLMVIGSWCLVGLFCLGAVLLKFPGLRAALFRGSARRDPGGEFDVQAADQMISRAVARTQQREARQPGVAPAGSFARSNGTPTFGRRSR
jgi:hypothetical protein